MRVRRGLAARAQHFRPALCVVAKLRKRKATVIVGKAVELHNPRGKKRLRATRIPPPGMMKSGGELNQSLQEALLRLGLGKPEFFPDFMGLKELPRVEKRHASPELFAFAHREPARFPVKFSLPRAISGRRKNSHHSSFGIGGT